MDVVALQEMLEKRLNKKQVNLSLLLKILLI